MDVDKFTTFEDILRQADVKYSKVTGKFAYHSPYHYDIGKRTMDVRNLRNKMSANQMVGLAAAILIELEHGDSQ